MPTLRPRVNLPEEAQNGRIMVSKNKTGKDNLLSAIVKWIPIEVIGAYEGIMGAIPEGNTGFRLWVTIVGIPVTALWIGFATEDDTKAQRIAWRHMILASVAFFCWTVGSQPVIVKSVITAWEPWMGTVTIGAGAVLLPILNGILRALKVPQ
jgi:hypothetical protein